MRKNSYLCNSICTKDRDVARIDQNTIDRIIDAARIEDVVRSYGVELQKAGTVLKACCPFHEEKTPSFVVSPAKGIFKCFGCGKGGHAVKFVMEKEQCSYPDALRRLAKRYNIEVPEREMTPEEKRAEMERQNILEINEWYAKFCAETMTNDPNGRAVGMSFFRERRFTDESMRVFRLGYAMDRNVVFEAAKAAGFMDDLIIKSGIGGVNEESGRRFDRFKGRVIFPIVNITGKVVAFGGRVLNNLSEEEKKRTGKYVNSPEILGIYEKNRELYGLFQAKSDIQRKDSCILVEGYADVISMHQAGMRNTVAACGTAFTERQMETVRRFTNNLIVMDDGDSAGIAAAQKAANIALKAGMSVKMVLLPDGQDPDDFAKNHSAELIEAYIEEKGMNFVEFKKKVLTEGKEDDPDTINAALGSVIETIALLPNAISREVYIKEAMKRFEMPREAIVERLNSMAMSEQQQKEKEERNKRLREEDERRAEEANRPTYKFAIQEREIVQFIVRHCGESIEVENEGTKERYYVTDVLLASLEDLEEEGRLLQNPMYEKFINCIKQEEITDDRYFTFNEDDDIRKIATSLLLDKEVASKRFDNDMKFTTPEDDPQYERKKQEFEARVQQEKELKLRTDLETVVKEYRLAVIRGKIAETKQAIKERPGEMLEQMRKLKEYMEQEQMLQYNG